MNLIRDLERAMVKMLKTTTLLIALLALFIFATVSIHAQSAAAGKEIYAKKCQTCHAADGSGNHHTGVDADADPKRAAEYDCDRHIAHCGAPHKSVADAVSDGASASPTRE